MYKHIKNGDDGQCPYSLADYTCKRRR